MAQAFGSRCRRICGRINFAVGKAAQGCKHISIATMSRMSSCRGHEFTPVFGAFAQSGSEASSSEDDAEAAGIAPATPRRNVGGEGGDGDALVAAADPGEDSEPDPFEDVEGAFADAKDRWKIDANTLKGFYLRGLTGQLYGWNQARGLLYEYDHVAGLCNVIWAACTPHLNAEIWTVLPLPPTDPASLQPSATVQAVPVLCLLHVTRGKALLRASAASATFCTQHSLNDSALLALERLPPAGQAYVARTFCPPVRDPSGALCRQVENLLQLGADRVPWAGATETAVLRVPGTGAILGRCVPGIAALCWDSLDDDLVAAAHCRVACVGSRAGGGRFSVCDLGSAEEGTLVDGRRIGAGWTTLVDGCHLDLGPIRIRVELTPVKTALDQALPPLISSGADADIGSKLPLASKRMLPQRGGWRSAKRTRTGGHGEFEAVAPAAEGAARGGDILAAGAAVEAMRPLQPTSWQPPERKTP